jgi:hypothetical protein
MDLLLIFGVTLAVGFAAGEGATSRSFTLRGQYRRPDADEVHIVCTST